MSVRKRKWATRAGGQKVAFDSLRTSLSARR